MKDDSKKNLIRQIITIGIAAGIFIFIFVKFWQSEKNTQAVETPDMVMMGDSIFANAYSGNFIAGPISEATGYTIADMTFGGTCLAYVDVDGRLDSMVDAYCMAALTQSIVAGDYRLQQNARVESNQTYFAERLEALKTIDFSGVKILLIEHMLNDYQSGVPAEAGTDPYNEYSYEGALRSVVTTIKKNYPDIRIILVTPTETWYLNDETGVMENSTIRDFGGGTIEDYIEVQKKVAEELQVEWISLIDLYNEDAGGEENCLWYDYTQEGIHPLTESFGLISECIGEHFENYK